MARDTMALSHLQLEYTYTQCSACISFQSSKSCCSVHMTQLKHLVGAVVCAAYCYTAVLIDSMWIVVYMLYCEWALILVKSIYQTMQDDLIHCIFL